MARPATKDELANLHSILAKTLKELIEDGAPTPATLNVARQFLKDNGIEADPEKSKDLNELNDALDGFDPDAVTDPHSAFSH